ncbi:MAG: type-F conjugative transfer system protein TraW [Gammaproteobacteria bacterium]|nr:type-F conjugative transfer system protein TraW [Gammaproteobacteria bacterium]
MRAAVLVLLLFWGVNAAAYNHGVLGRIYSINEIDLIEFIQNELRQKEKSGELTRLNNEFLKKTKVHIDRPSGVHLKPATRCKSWEFNPEIVLSRDIYDSENHLIAKRGVRINPLDTVKLTSTLLIFDGDNTRQRTWAEAELLKTIKAKLILSSGSIEKASNHFKRAVYFDLNAYIVNKFQISALPAKVEQQGKRLLIQEIVA